MVLIPRLREANDACDDRLRLIVVDRQPLFLSALGEVVTSARPGAQTALLTDSEEALKAIMSRSIDLVFCEARAKPLTGPELAAKVNEVSPMTRCILLGDAEDRSLLVAALACGATGFFTKDASPDEFLDGVEAVLAGHYVIGKELIFPTLARLAELAPSDEGHQLDQLSAAERGILTLVGQAQSIRSIADSRGISQKTVRNHLASIYRKLQLRNRSEAILWSARMGLLSGPEAAMAGPA